jgi:hypothetical protein
LDADSDIDMSMSNDVFADASDNNNIPVQQNFENVNANNINSEIYQTVNTAAASLNLERQTKRKTSYLLPASKSTNLPVLLVLLDHQSFQENIRT